MNFCVVRGVDSLHIVEHWPGRQEGFFVGSMESCADFIILMENRNRDNAMPDEAKMETDKQVKSSARKDTEP